MAIRRASGSSQSLGRLPFSGIGVKNYRDLDVVCGQFCSLALTPSVICVLVRGTVASLDFASALL
jgi:hypothetical protein